MTILSPPPAEFDTVNMSAQAAYADGPWGPAVKYWLDFLKWRQADLARASGIEPKTISTIFRGYDTTTRMLRKITRAFQQEAKRQQLPISITLEDVLVSPDRKSEAERRKLMVQEIVERVWRDVDEKLTPVRPEPAALHPTMKQIVAEIEAYADDPQAKTSDAAADEVERTTRTALTRSAAKPKRKSRHR